MHKLFARFAFVCCAVVGAFFLCHPTPAHAAVSGCYYYSSPPSILGSTQPTLTRCDGNGMLLVQTPCDHWAVGQANNAYAGFLDEPSGNPVVPAGGSQRMYICGMLVLTSGAVNMTLAQTAGTPLVGPPVTCPGHSDIGYNGMFQFGGLGQGYVFSNLSIFTSPNDVFCFQSTSAQNINLIITYGFRN